MKHIIISYFTFFILLLITSCKDDSPKQNDESLNKIEFINGESPIYLTFDASGGSQSLKFRTNESWKITIEEQESNNWLSYSYSSENDGVTNITFKASANSDTNSRNCKVIISTFHYKAYIEVTQMQKDAIVISHPSYKLTEVGGKIEIKIGHNVDFETNISANWIQQINNSRTYNTKTLVFQINENTNKNRRIGAITFSSKDKKISQKIKIIQESKESKNINDNYVHIDWKENELIKCEPENGIYSFIVSENNKPQLEKGSVFIVDKDKKAYIAIAKEITEQNNVVTIKAINGSIADIFHDIDFTLTNQPSTYGNGNVIYPYEIVYYNQKGNMIVEQCSSYRSSIKDNYLTSQKWTYHQYATNIPLLENDAISLGVKDMYIDLRLNMNMYFNFGGINKIEMPQEGFERHISDMKKVSANMAGVMSFKHLLAYNISKYYSTSIKKEILNDIFKPIYLRFMVNGVLVQVELNTKLYLEASLKVDGKLSSEVDFTYNTDGKVGIEWEQSLGEPTPIKEVSHKFNFTPINIEGKGITETKVAISPNFYSTIYGIKSSSFDFKPFLTTNISGGYNKDLLSSNKNFCTWQFKSCAGSDFNSSLNIMSSSGEKELQLSDYFSKEELNLIHTPLYDSPIDIELATENYNDIQKDKPIDVSFNIYDNFYLLENTKVRTSLPHIVKFEGQGKLSSIYDIVKNGTVTINWTPSSSYDSLRAVLYDYEGKVIKRTVLKGKNKLCPNNNHPHFIDLGLPSGVKWACCNVGSKQPEDYGSCFRWGEILPKVEGIDYIKKDISCISGKPEYDAATANWGSPSRMPTLKEMEELKNNCTIKWINYNKNLSGILITSKINGNCIFLPASGVEYDNINLEGYYWSGTSHSPLFSFAFYFYDSSYGTSMSDVEWGHRIRPVQ